MTRLNAAVISLDDFDDPARTRIDQNRTVVHNRVTVLARAIFLRHVVIGNAFLRKNRANPDILAIFMRRVMPFDDITVEAGTLIDAQNPGNSTDNTTNDTADDGPDWTGGSLAFS
jgi:hypothetical protein